MASRSAWSSKYAGSISGCQRGLVDRSRICPRLDTLTSVGASGHLAGRRFVQAVVPEPARPRRAPAGRARPGRRGCARTRRPRRCWRPAGRCRVALARAKLTRLLNSARSLVSLVWKMSGAATWSCRFCADAGQVVDDLDADLAQVGRGADAGQHQQLGRVDGATGQDHLGVGVDRRVLVAGPVGDADRASAVDDHPLDEGAGAHGEVRPILGRLEVGLGHRPAATLLAGHLVEPGALLVGAVEVVGRLEAGRDRATRPRPRSTGGCSDGPRRAVARPGRGTAPRAGCCPRP